VQERPTRDRQDTNATKNSNLTGKREMNFGKRKLIDIDENDDSIANAGELENILSRGARLQQQMA